MLRYPRPSALSEPRPTAFNQGVVAGSSGEEWRVGF